MLTKTIGTSTLICGDSRDVLKEFPDNYFSAVVTDPPYELTSIQKRFGKPDSAPCQEGTDGAFARAARGFMGAKWDGTGIQRDPAFWSEVLRVLKPGGHALVFGGTRTHFRMACALEDAGFEIRDTILCPGLLAWVYGTGFPKSLSVDKALDKMANAERVVTASHERAGRSGGILGIPTRIVHEESIPATPAAQEWQGWGSALKPAWEPVYLCRKPLEKGLGIAANVLKHGTGALNIDACRIPTGGEQPQGSGNASLSVAMNPRYSSNGGNVTPSAGRFPSNVVLSHSPLCTESECDPSCAVLDLGRQSGGTKSSKLNCTQASRTVQQSKGAERARVRSDEGFTDEGTAARFFFQARYSDLDDLSPIAWFPKPATSERSKGCEELAAVPPPASARSKPAEGRQNALGSERSNHHPTVKSVELMRYLSRLVCPPGGIVLDPFMGSGTTLVAAAREGFAAVGIEQDATYHTIACARVSDAANLRGLFAQVPDSPSTHPANDTDDKELQGSLFHDADSTDRESCDEP